MYGSVKRLEELEMLVEFSVKNYRSIKDKVTLSLTASSEDIHPGNVFSDPSGKVRLLKTAAIYGANASGKSNVIMALQTMRQLVLKSHELQRGEKIDVIPFRLDPDTVEQPTEFEVVFIKDGRRFIYGFSADQYRVREEWLSEANLDALKVAPRMLFHRELQSDGTYGDPKLGDYWKPKNRSLWNETNDNTLFLAKSAQNNHPHAAIVFDWFRRSFRTISSEPENSAEMRWTAGLCERDPEVKSMIQAMLKDADLGIEDFTCEKEPLEESRVWPQIQDELRLRLSPDLAVKHVSVYLQKVISKHLMADGVTHVDFDLKDNESDGTQRLFSLAGPFIHSLLNGNVLFCDELDSSLHPTLTRSLIDMVHRHSGSFQLIFTTHDSSLLDAELFRRDQIWFTEKNRSMSTDLYSLWDIKPRAGENFRKGYLNGRYGAIPFLGDFNLWETEESRTRLAGVSHG